MLGFAVIILRFYLLLLTKRLLCEIGSQPKIITVQRSRCCEDRTPSAFS